MRVIHSWQRKRRVCISVLMRPERKGGGGGRVSIFETPSSREEDKDCQRLQRRDQATHSQEAGASNDSWFGCCVVGSNPNTFIVRLASSGSKPSGYSQQSEVSTCGKYKSKFCGFGWVSNLKLQHDASYVQIWQCQHRNCNVLQIFRVQVFRCRVQF